MAAYIEHASNFHYFFAYFSTFELHVVYTGNIIDISAQQSSIQPKIDEVPRGHWPENPGPGGGR